MAGPDNSITVSQTITNQVLRERISLLSNDLFQPGGLVESPSLVESRICSVLCVPLVILENSLGAIYLDTSDPASRFDEGHLQLLTAIAAIAAAPIENARRVEWLEAENQRLREEIHVEHQMIGESAAMRAVYQFIGKVGATDSTVLIRGESGTGKELAARAIHLNSPRSAKAFVAINGARLSETLLESELFGHEKGSFTGAIAQKRGKLEVADGGTLFLDEVGELTGPIQAKLLRVLQEQEFERVGGTRPIKVDVRIVAATNKDLEDALTNGSFRQDLYYRLNVVSVTMPALQDRRDDIQLIASYFSSVFSKKCRRRIQGISPEARAVLRAYDWPGNVRELENAIERALVLSSTEMIVPEDLPEAVFETGKPSELPAGGYHDQLKRAKQSIVLKAIEAAGGNYTEAAKHLGLHATNLHRLIRNLDLKTTLKK
jgi:Nif-specific regulatory protein